MNAYIKFMYLLLLWTGNSLHTSTDPFVDHSSLIYIILWEIAKWWYSNSILSGTVYKELSFTYCVVTYGRVDTRKAECMLDSFPNFDQFCA